VGEQIAISEAQCFERRQVRGVAFALGFYFSFRLAIVLISVDVLSLEPSTGTALNLGLDLLFFLLVCFDSAGPAWNPAKPIWKLPAARWVLVYLAFSALSLLWSESASKATSLAYWFGLVLDVASVILLLRASTGDGDVISLTKGFIWSSCLLALVAWMMPAQSDLRLGDEQYFNTNEIGNLCAMATLFAQFLTRRNHEHWRFAKVLLVLTVIRSLSKSTILAFLISESVLLVLDRSMRRKTKVLLLGGALALILAFWGLFEAYYDVYTTAGNQAETLTGRTAIWLYVLNAAFDQPWSLWIGHGFDSWWKVVPPFGNEMFEARHAENEMLQQFYAYGIAGVALLAAIYSGLIVQLRKLTRSPTKILLISTVLFILVRGMAVADSFDLLLPLWAIVMLSLFIERLHNEQQVTSPTSGGGEILLSRLSRQPSAVPHLPAE
jgi:exopolysaccharide production protein ExoQ